MRVKKRLVLLAFVPFVCLALPLVALAGTPELDVSTAAIKGQNKVAIAEFGVEFFTQLNGKSTRGAARADVSSTLAGVDDADFQAITDKAYADTVAALQQAGFEVVDPSVLQSNATYRELGVKYGHPSPYINEDKHFGDRKPTISKIFAPSGTGLLAYYQSSNKSDVLRGSVGERIDVQNQGRGAKEGEIAKALGVTLLHINYLASFGEPNNPKHNGLFSGMTARAKVTVSPMLWADETALQFVTEAGGRTFGNSRMRHNGWVALDDELVGDAGVFTSADTTTAKTKRNDLVVGAIGVLLGGGSAQKTRDNEVTPTSAEAYRATFGSLIAETANAFAGKLGAAR
ncbi:hypothetical protein [Thermomonas sp. HDW16]|uniref:hypothetical protein n=1 Tax=Thermomonas sp. HDW16 TaxID=2714945 RepID=UPI001409D856|nr:hypothetical protein [Thermomonas sp. HDW16]QIL21109.1 hypothetical protein G7079_10420 [Thermomonas sp. HDW16]